MKKLKQMISLFLCVAMMVPAPAVYGSSGLPEETLAIEEAWEEDVPEETEPDTIEVEAEGDRFDPVLPAKPMEWDGDLVIYWNPNSDNRFLNEFSSASPSKASDSNIDHAGSDHADGLTPATAVNSLNTAIRRAEKLSRQQEVEVSDIVIRAMSPMLVPAGQLYTVRGRGVHITSWSERTDDSEMIFAVDGGQLTLHNIVLEPEDGGINPESAELIHIKSGKVQLGENVESYGSFVLDYQLGNSEINWSSQSEAQASDSEANSYVEPVIELLKRFEPVSDYLLDLRTTDHQESVVPVASLFSDSQSTEEFMEAFVLVDHGSEEWNLYVEERIGGVLRDTTEEELAAATGSEATPSEVQSARLGMEKKEDSILTQKNLVASRTPRISEKVVFWNPGPGFLTMVNGVDTWIPAGSDNLFDGTKIEAPVRSWYKAREVADGGTVICMQTVDLSTAGADTMKFDENGTYLDADGNFVLDGRLENTVTLTTWSGRAAPIVKIPDNTSIVLKNLTLQGNIVGGAFEDAQILVSEGGQIILEQNVNTSFGYFQINLRENNKAKDHPVIVNNTDVKANLYFGGINEQLGWRFLDVIIAGDNLIGQAGSEQGAGISLLQQIHLEEANSKTIEENGSSQFKWELRVDTSQDLDGGEFSSHLELYTTYYYDAVYVDGVRGENTNYGATCNYPVETFQKAKEVLAQEMATSLAARQEAYDNNQDWTKYSYPAKIYICGTLTVEGEETWDLPTYYTDVDGTPIKIELISHTSSALNELEQVVHESPDTLVHVKGSTAKLTLSTALIIQNKVDKKNKDTYTIVVDDGAVLRFEADSALTGLTDAGNIESRTHGTHILVGKNPKNGIITSGELEMPLTWTGSIHSKQYGIRSYGAGNGTISKITMDTGKVWNHVNKISVTNNNAYQSGVYLDHTEFTMNGGSISENTSNEGGSGVYIDGGSTFNLKGGIVEKNKALTLNSAGMFDNTLISYGLGVYVADGGTFHMGTPGSTDHEANKVANHEVKSQFRGVGVYVSAGGTYHLYSGTISGNKGDGTSHYNNNYTSMGGGIANFGTFKMTDGLITDNGYSYTGGYALCLGGGLYLGGTSQTITDGLFTANNTGRYINNYSIAYNGGGGIYVRTSATIENIIVENNRSFVGAGIAVYLNDNSQLLTIRDCTIQNNIGADQSHSQYPNATRFGQGAGINFQYSNVNAERLNIIGNQAWWGGGAYFAGSQTVTLTDCNIKDNKAYSLANNDTGYGHGGGIYNAARLVMTNVLVENNHADMRGGGIWNNSGIYPFDLKVLTNTSKDGGGIYNSNGIYFRSSKVSGNIASNDGGGIYTTNTAVVTDTQIINNEAGNYGGGVYNTSTMHLAERIEGETQITGNAAKYGGGIYQVNGQAFIDIKEPLKNKVSSADGQGTNIYQSQTGGSTGHIYFLGGEIRQPDVLPEGVYSIFIDTTGTGEAHFFIDPQKASAHGERPVYLNTANNNIVYIRDPLPNSVPNLPISMNVDKFEIGTPVVKPANIKEINVARSKADATGAENYKIDYGTYYRNAATPNGLAYAAGGKRPARTELSGCLDPKNVLFTNIVLVGQGVYLDGEGGSDDISRDGRTPETAVKTFRRANELLEEYTDDANNDDQDTLGFSPFIYICGTVTINSNETWELQSTADRYLADSKYRQAEIDLGRVPEYAQVKRFASFLTKPLVKVTGSGTTLTIPDLIVNGMSDAVNTIVQGRNSYMFDVTEGHMVLGDRANIRNNYANMIRIDNKGTIKIISNTPDSESFTNKQVEVIWGDGIELQNESTIEMSGYASVVIPNNSKNMANQNAYMNYLGCARGIILQNGSKLTMSDNSKVIYTGAELPLEAKAAGVVMGNRVLGLQKKSQLIMKNNAEISNFYLAIGLFEYDSDIQLIDQVKLKDNAIGIFGYNQGRAGISISMSDDASIHTSYERSADRIAVHGIYISDGNSNVGTNAKTDITLTGNSSIHDLRDYGMYIGDLHSDVTITMTDAKLYQTHHAIYLKTIRAKINVSMKGRSSISDTRSGGNGIYIQNTQGRSALVAVDLFDEAKISGVQHGIQVESASVDANVDSVINITMGGESKILDGTGCGIVAQNINKKLNIMIKDRSSLINNKNQAIYMINTYDETNLTIKDDAFIEKQTDGIYSCNGHAGLVNISLEGRSYISGSSRYGIYMRNTGSWFDQFNINMSDSAWIGSSAAGTGARGIYIESDNGRVNPNDANGFDMTGKYKIKMSGTSMIGGTGVYNGSEVKRGFLNSGIYSQLPVQIEMSADSKISFNASEGILLGNQNGTSLLNFQGKSIIILKDNAAISNSNYGIQTNDKKRADGTYTWTQDVELYNNSAIRDTVVGNLLLTQGDLSVYDNSQITAPSRLTENVVKLNGSLHLDGTARVNGLIYLLSGASPVTLRSPVPNTDPVGKYRLHLAEGYVGQIVVKPAGSLANVTLYEDYFIKEKADGLAQERDLVSIAPNIVLLGENNVYLSGMGSDLNNGTTPTTAVRTFGRAKELLASGLYTEGANILICDVPGKSVRIPVQIIEGDEEWSFDEGGYLTNTQTHRTWKPMVKRHETYYGIMIQLMHGTKTSSAHTSAASLTLKDIVIDGYGEHDVIRLKRDYAKEILKITKGTVTLGKNSVLQNNHRDMQNNTSNNTEMMNLGVYIEAAGSLIIDGGTIQDIKIDRFSNNYRLPMGLAIYNMGSVTMNSGLLQNNTLQSVGNPAIYFVGVVLNNNNSSFIMNGGTITENAALPSSVSNENVAGGGLVFLATATGKITNGLISNNKGGKGSAIYYASTNALTMEGGRIIGNQAAYWDSIGSFSPIYIAGDKFTLDGGGSILDDAIYLGSTKHIITVSNNIYQVTRKYKVYLNKGTAVDHFQKGSTVVQPDNNYLKNASQYLLNFDIRSEQYIVDRGKSKVRKGGTITGVKENQCLILMQAVFLDTDRGDDVNHLGTSPEDAVSTFAKAKDIGEGPAKSSETRDYFIIFISGLVKPADGERWDLAEISYLCRYTGFPLYQANGRPIEVEKPLRTYHNYLIEPAGSFTLGDIQIYGRRVIDSTAASGDSIIRVMSGRKVTITKGTVLSRNYNRGSYVDDDGLLIALSMKGGAITVELDGQLYMNGGTISETEDQYGTAIYQKAEEGVGTTRYGYVKLDQIPYVYGENNSPIIQGGIYLEGRSLQAQAYLETSGQYIPKQLDGKNGKLRIRLGSDYSGRPVVSYADGFIPGEQQISYYELEDFITAVYDLTNRLGETNVLELQLRQVIYLDGQNGSNLDSGETPDEALETLAGVYAKLRAMGPSSGAMVFVVDRLDVEKNVTLVNEKYIKNGQLLYGGRYILKDNADNEIERIEINSLVYFKRYSKPATDKPEYVDSNTYLGSLFNIEQGGKLTLNGMFLDGHSEPSESSFDYLKAPAVKALAPLITVNPGGSLIAGLSVPGIITGGGDPQVGKSTETRITNNVNAYVKTNVLGQSDQGVDVYEGSSAGIEILSNGANQGYADLSAVEFINLSMGSGVNGGSDVYQNGRLSAQQSTMFTGTVFLEGLGSGANTASSRYINVNKYGTPFMSNFKLLLRDPYNGRKVIEYKYDAENPDGPADTDIGNYLLEERVNRYYALNKRPAPEKHILELTIPQAVYLDGQAGNNDNNGYIPSKPVKTLEKAYQRLAESGGKVLYILGTVDISQSTEISSTMYQSGGAIVRLFVSTDRVDIRRYVRPKAGEAGAHFNVDYDVNTFEGTLFHVKNGSIFTIKDTVYLDGHHSPKDEGHYPIETFVENPTTVKGPLVEVEYGGSLKLHEGVTLHDNWNTKEPVGSETQVMGGAIKNSGKVELSGAVIRDNEALKGAGIYQEGTFDLFSNPERIAGQEIYLTTKNTGNEITPIWGEDHIIETAVWISDQNLKLDLNMDHAVPGRPVIKYTSHTGVDLQYAHYNLGITVADTLFMVENEHDDALLELQDWRILDVKVPKEIFLVIQQNRLGDLYVKDAESDDMMMAGPIYTIQNNGRYDAKVSLSGFVNQNADAGITDYEVMNLVASPADAMSDSASRKDLYLAIKGTNLGDSFSGLPETSLYDFDVDGAKKQEMGVLVPESEAKFEFTAAASRRFLSYYVDPAFPFFGAAATGADRVAHIRDRDAITGETSANHARAKYKLTYRVEIMPPRR